MNKTINNLKFLAAGLVLLGTSAVAQGQIREDILPPISPKFTAIILDENEKPVCFGLSIPSLAQAFVGTRGHITPGLALRFLKCIRHPGSIDMCLIGADPEYLNRGVSAALSVAIMHMFKQHPEVKYADTLLNLEENWAIQNQWKRFKRDVVKRYRCYVKSL